MSTETGIYTYPEQQGLPPCTLDAHQLGAQSQYKPVLEDMELKIVSLRVAGFPNLVIAGEIHHSISNVKNTLSKLCKRLGVESTLEAALLLARHSLIDVRALPKGLDIIKFNYLTEKQIATMDALIGWHRKTNNQTVEHLDIEKKAHNDLPAVARILGVKGIGRISLGVSYWLYNKDNNPRESTKAIQLSEEQIEIMRLTALGLSAKEVSGKLPYGESAIKNKLVDINKILNVKSALGAVLKLIKEGKIDPVQLVAGFDLSLFDSFSRLQLNLIKVLVGESDGFDKRDKVLAGSLERAESTIENRFMEMREILGFLPRSSRPKVRMAVLYLAYLQQKKKAEQKETEALAV